MKFFALIFLVVGNLIVGQAFAGDISGQPLTRADCDRAAMTWDETANVCTANERRPVPGPPYRLPQKTMLRVNH